MERYTTRLLHELFPSYANCFAFGKYNLTNCQIRCTLNPSALTAVDVHNTIHHCQFWFKADERLSHIKEALNSRPTCSGDVTNTVFMNCASLPPSERETYQSEIKLIRNHEQRVHCTFIQAILE